MLMDQEKKKEWVSVSYTLPLEAKQQSLFSKFLDEASYPFAKKSNWKHQSLRYKQKYVEKETYNFIEEKGIEELSKYKQIVKALCKEKYNFIEEKEIFDFLLENNFLIYLIEDAYYAITDYFPASNLTIKLNTDPEIDDYKKIFIYIHTELEVDDAVKQLEKFDNNWWLQKIAKTQNKLCITLRF